jgi:cell division protease FtsH
MVSSFDHFFSKTNKVTLPFNKFINKIESHEFEKIYFDQNLNIVYGNDENNVDTIYESNIVPSITYKIMDASIQNNVDTFFNQNNNINPYSILYYVILGSIFLNFMTRNMMPFLPKMDISTTNIVQNNITLHDVCLSNEVKDECFEIVSYFKNSTDYKLIGAEIPKGILLEGPPGTGKTLIAKAIANEANVNFISVSGSEFVELFVGMGALKIRKLFENARKNKPSIIFIDEIDAVGKTRSPNSLNDEKDQTLNQLLVEMDGFTPNDDVIILASTNRKDILDKALLRPGRFDRIVNIPLPNNKSRLQILELYLNKKNTTDIHLPTIAEMTAGYSGAEIKNMVNEAAIIALRNKTFSINQDHLIKSIEKISIGLVITDDNRSLYTKRRVAIHECGHALVAKTFGNYFELTKVTIEPMNNGIGGFTLYNENPFYNGLITKDFLKKKIMVYLAGKIAEELYLGVENTSVGASMDLAQANKIAYDMIEKFGFGKISPNHSVQNRISDSFQFSIDKEVNDLINELYIETREIIKNKKQVLDKLINQLIIHKKLNNDEFVI